MKNRQDTDFIVGVLSEAVERGSSNATKLANATRLRKKVHAAIQSGEVLDHYRYKWLNDQSHALIELLQIMAAEFDEAHPADICSVQDLIDIMSVASTKLRQRAEAVAAEAEESGEE